MAFDTEESFLLRLRTITLHAAKEGPHHNILQNAQEACDMASALREEVAASYASAPSTPTLIRLIACDATLGALLIGAEEEEKGVAILCRAYTLLLHTKKKSENLPLGGVAVGDRDDDDNKASASAITASPEEIVVPMSLEAILQQETSPNAEVVASGSSWSWSLPFWGSSLHMHMLNSLALYATKTVLPLPVMSPPVEDKRADSAGDGEKAALEMSIALLQRSESIYQEWDAHESSSTPPAMHVIQLPISEEGELLLASVPHERHAAYWERFHMEDTRITTLFYLAQALTSKGEMVQAFRYCHITLYLQLVLHKETSKMEWARNTLQLSSHYCNFGAFDQAFHCLQAADALMPKDTPDEENVGVLAWSYGRFYKHRLQYFADERRSQTRGREEALDFSKGWLDFPIEGVPPCSPVPPLEHYDDAREEFKKGLKWINTALEYFPFDLMCTSHIELQQDICRLYDALSAFETDPNREIALVQRQISVLDTFPAKLNFNSYPTLIRQLLYDIGCLREHLIELRVGQRQRHARAVEATGVGALTSAMTEEKPISDTQLNKLVCKAAKNFQDFCQSWMTAREVEERRAKNLPAPSIGNIVIEEGSRVAFFRAMMRIARLHTMMAYPNPKEEYEGIQRACQDYEKAVAFAERNPFPKDAPASKSEVEYAKELINLLRVKQSDLYGVFAR